MSTQFSNVKTYSRRQAHSATSQTFDGTVGKVSTSKATPTLKRFGAASFTSSRSKSSPTPILEKVALQLEPEAKKRKVATDKDVAIQGIVGEDDHFSFDTEEKTGTSSSRAYSADKAVPRNNQAHKHTDEPDSLKQARMQTLTRQQVVDSRKKHLLANTDGKLAKSGDIAGPWTNIKECKKATEDTIKKRFFSSPKKATQVIQNASAVDPGGEETYNSDDLENLDSGDPEIIFNSPRKREKEVRKALMNESRTRQAAKAASVWATKPGLSHSQPSEDVVNSNEGEEPPVFNSRSGWGKGKSRVLSNSQPLPASSVLFQTAAHEIKPMSASDLFDQALGRVPASQGHVSSRQGHALARQALNSDTFTSDLLTEKRDRISPLLSETKGQPGSTAKPSASSFAERFQRRGSTNSTSSSGSLEDVPKLRKVATLPVGGKQSKLSMLEDGEEKKRKLSKKLEQPVVRRILTSPRKRRIQYNPRCWSQFAPDDSDDAQSTSQSTQDTSQHSLSDVSPPISGDPNITRSSKGKSSPWDEEVTALRVDRPHKPLFMVVRHVKQAHECQESGETQDFNDDLEYILQGLTPGQNTSIRCLSVLNLATKCLIPVFRMHLRAHGVLDTVCSKLDDAYKSPSLAVCVSAVLYLISLDRFAVEVDSRTLKLMVQLLSMDPQSSDSDLTQTQSKVFEICDKMPLSKGQHKLEAHQCSTGVLAMDSLLNLTYKKEGEKFKEELRTLGGLDHIVNAVGECTQQLSHTGDTQLILDDPVLRGNLRRVERCLKVLENVTLNNKENQYHLAACCNSSVFATLASLLMLCEKYLTMCPLTSVGGKTDKDCTAFLVYNTVLAILRLTINLTHEQEFGCTKVGKMDGFVPAVLRFILQIPQYVPAAESFDLRVLGLSVLVNLVEHCIFNRFLLVRTHTVTPFDENSPMSVMDGTLPALEALTKFFVQRWKAVKLLEVEIDLDREKEKDDKARAEKNFPHQYRRKQLALGLDDIGLGMDGSSEDTELRMDVLPASQPEEDDTFTKALHKAGRHMEDCVLAAYVALVLGSIIQGNSDYIDTVRCGLPEGDFVPMIRMLKKFLGFMNFTNAAVIQGSGAKSIHKILEVLQDC